ncbi:MAG: PEP-CTERM/exosortase system-associated acyltransferase [Hyphomicrobiales bacterium]|nr:PEP-CTERM/exosortase system-associated acyltransferase [Hyphomicrobiales bacterium]
MTSLPPETGMGQRAPASEALIDVYDRYFEVIDADSPALLEECHRLRYQVYVVENTFEDPNEHPGGLERDDFDSHASHCLLVHRPSGAFAGTVRLILPLADAPGGSFPFQDVCREPVIDDPRRFPALKMGEISRFSISKRFRQRRTDTMYPDALDENVGRNPVNGDFRRVIPHMTLGLMEGIIRMCVHNGLSHVCAVMEPQLLRLLARVGIRFDPVGPLIEHHGTRQPCFRHLLTLLDEVKANRPDVWAVMTKGGQHVEALLKLE